MNSRNTDNNTQAQELLSQLEELLVRRDRLYKEAGSFLVEYMKEFGELVVANFELKIACIEQKKAIGYCRRRMNRGLPVDLRRMQAELEQEMKLYYVQLQDLVEEADTAKKAQTVDEFRLSRAKKIYRRLAKMLHPDINRRTESEESLQDLWARIVQAYNMSNVDELEDLEVLARKTMEELGEDAYEIDLSGLEERIERVERQINDILTTTPYTYGEMLWDEKAKEEHRWQLQAEHDDYEQYRAMLQRTLTEMAEDGKVEMIWRVEPQKGE